MGTRSLLASDIPLPVFPASIPPTATGFLELRPSRPFIEPARIKAGAPFKNSRQR